MSRVIFVGMHNKPDKSPLCISTKSGKLINRVVQELDIFDVVLSNLYDRDKLPAREERWELAIDWHYRISPKKDDSVVLLGALVHDGFLRRDFEGPILKHAHQSSKRSHEDMDWYVDDMVYKINDLILTYDEQLKLYKAAIRVACHLLDKHGIYKNPHASRTSLMRRARHHAKYPKLPMD